MKSPSRRPAPRVLDPERVASRTAVPAGVAVLLAGAVMIAGCVERTIEVRSDPPGATVLLDRMPVGRTPIDIPFSHYGVREVAVEMEGWEGEARTLNLWPPWYQIFPLDFLFDCVFPFTVRDQRSVEFQLRRTAPAGDDDLENLRKRAEETRRPTQEE